MQLSAWHFCILMVGVGSAHAQSPLQKYINETSSKKTSGHALPQMIGYEDTPPVTKPEFLRDPLEDQMDSIMAYASRCPSREGFIISSQQKLKLNALTMIFSSADSCEKLDMSRLHSFKHMESMQKFYKNLQIDNNDTRRPLDSMLNALKSSCSESFNGGVSAETLGLLYDLTCSGATPPAEDAFTGEDYAEAYNDPNHTQHGAVQKQIDSYAKDYAAITSKGWNAEYDEALKTKLVKSPLVNNPTDAMLKDLTKLCPAFAQASVPTLTPAEQELRAKVWTAVFDAMAMAESAHKPTTTYLESFGPLSTGMLQISYASARGHAGMCKKASRSSCGCSQATTEDLKKPVYNLECGVTIMESQMINAKRGLFGPKSYYWSVLNTTQNGFPKVMGRLKAIKSDASRWPQACGS